MKNPVRVRFAPSPTGPLHLGGVRTALYNYLFARHHGGDFVLRIEDTDQQRFVPGAEHYICEALRWAGISPNEGVGFGDGPYAPYRQSERKPIYRDYAMQLVQNGNAYYAFDTAEELEDLRNQLKEEGSDFLVYGPHSRSRMKNSLTLSDSEVQQKLLSGQSYVIRFLMPAGQTVRFQDEIRGEVSFQTDVLDDKVLFKSDGMPTYHLANVVDDYLMRITHVIRGEEWLSSTPLHVLLYQALDIADAMPSFSHIPLILRPDGKGKLSKRDGDRLGFPSFPLTWTDPLSAEESQGYRERGFYPEAFINFLALLGWNPGNNQELMSPAELIESFSLQKVHKSGARFDFDKAKWFNEQYLRQSNGPALAEIVRKIALEKYGSVDMDYLSAVCELMKERCTFPGDILSKGYFFFEPIHTWDKEQWEKRYSPQWIDYIRTMFDKMEETGLTDAQELEQWTKEKLTADGRKPGEIIPLLRLGLSGIMNGPGVFDIMCLWGIAKTREVFEQSITFFTKK